MPAQVWLDFRSLRDLARRLRNRRRRGSRLHPQAGKHQIARPVSHRHAKRETRKNRRHQKYNIHEALQVFLNSAQLLVQLRVAFQPLPLSHPAAAFSLSAVHG